MQYGAQSLPEDFETSILAGNLHLYKVKDIDLDKIHELYKGYRGFNGRWLETAKYVIFDSFDEGYRNFISIYDKERKEIVAQARMFINGARFNLILPPAFTSQFEDNTFVSVFPGYVLQSLTRSNSPFYDSISKNADNNFVVEVKLK